MKPALFPTIGPREEREYIAAARKRRPVRRAEVAHAIRLAEARVRSKEGNSAR
jgi:hypothetical protein